MYKFFICLALVAVVRADLTADEKSSVVAAWKEVGDKGKFGLDVFAKVFVEHPDYANHFPESMRTGGIATNAEFKNHIEKRVMAAVTTAIGDMDAAQAYLVGVGKNHKSTPVKRATFLAVKDPFLVLMKDTVGATYNEAAWTKFLDFALGALGDGVEA